jgi:hypothetical protein
MLLAVVLTALAILIFIMPSIASAPIPVVDTTITVNEFGALHTKIVQTVPDNKDGAVEYNFELRKQYLPENVSVYDYVTGDPLNYALKETDDSYGYEVHFNRPYYDGYTFVVEYDCHRRIIYEGSGEYSLGMSLGADTRSIDRTYTVVLPVRNFTYLGYKETLDHATSETDTGNSIRIVFHKVINAGTDYGWEIQFKASGIDGEVHKTEVANFNVPIAIPGMSFIAAIIAFFIIVLVKKR